MLNQKLTCQNFPSILFEATLGTVSELIWKIHRDPLIEAEHIKARNGEQQRQLPNEIDAEHKMQKLKFSGIGTGQGDCLCKF